ncbi:MAG: cytochrome c biogenesis protein CcdA, partial [Chloroflexota bacterium]
MELNVITMGAAFVAGLFSFVSPCCLPLMPAYLSYITGISVDEFSAAQIASRRRHIVVSAVAFVIGLSLVFTLLGATATLLGQFLLDHQELIAHIAGLLIIVFGLHTLGILRIPLLDQEKRLDFTKRRAPGVVGAVVMGSAFGVGWTPCVGQFLGSILLLASQTGTVGAGMLLLFTYGMGLGLPFIVAGLLIGQITPLFARIKRHTRALTYASGGLLVLMGFLVFTNQMTAITAFLIRNFGYGFA